VQDSPSQQLLPGLPLLSVISAQVPATLSSPLWAMLYEFAAQVDGLLGRRLSLARRLTLDCGASNSIGQKEQIRCRECGHRVMYKKRTRRMGILSHTTPQGTGMLMIVQFEAR
jgi:DNA-directed RNA polymerase subunit RPC12/RpoP